MEKIKGIRKIKEKDLILIDRDTYMKLLKVYKEHRKIPHVERIKIMESRSEDEQT